MALDEADALERVMHGGVRADIILLDQMEQSIDQLVEMGQSICQTMEFFDDTLIAIMAERYGVDLEGQDIQIGEREYVTYLEDGQQLRNLLHKLCPI